MIGGQKWGVILGIPWLICYNTEIDWKIEVYITECLDECEKKQRRERQIKPRWQKQKKKEEKEKLRKPTTDEEIVIARIVEKELNKEKDLTELRSVEKIVPRQFYRYLKVFEKKESERMLIRKICDHAIDSREGFVPKKKKIYLLLRVEREEVQKFARDQLRK